MIKTMEKFNEKAKQILDELRADGFTFTNSEHKHTDFINKVSFTKNGITAKVNLDFINGNDISWFTPDAYYDFVKGYILKCYDHAKNAVYKV